MIEERFVLNDFHPVNGDVFLAGKESVTKSEGIGSINSKFKIDDKYRSTVCFKLCLYLN